MNSNFKTLKHNKFISNNASCYNLKNLLQIMEIKLTKNFYCNTGLKNSASTSNQNINDKINIKKKK